MSVGGGAGDHDPLTSPPSGASRPVTTHRPGVGAPNLAGPRPSSCRKCGSALTGRQRMWCSENCRKRYHENHSRAACPKCGAPMRAGSGYGSHAPRQCRPCRERERQVQRDERGERIVGWWAAGLTLKQIGEKLGWTKNHVTVEVNRLRSEGYDLPYRHRFAKPRFPEQVGA